MPQDHPTQTDDVAPAAAETKGRPDSDRLVTGALTAAWLAGAAWFWSWWISEDHWVSATGIYLTSLTILVTFSLAAWYLSFSLRARPEVPTELDPDLRVAAIVTKVPSEPWEVVRGTITNLLNQDYPHPFDVWLADEDPTDETLEWCQEHDVEVSCRKDVPEYHSDTWPRRARCKEGNLAYFYDTVGYDRYDVVAQFDADHAAEPDYLRTVVPYFVADDEVGYVAAPSICDLGSDTSWAARGRLYREAPFHGSLQTSTDGLAPVCIGSHYTVRTEALLSIGGLGPELAEDFSTSFLMNSDGWTGRFAPDAIAHGDGPESFADAMKQEMQWSRSLVVLLLDQTRGHWPNLQWGERIRLGFSLAYYPIFVAQMILGTIFAPLALITGVPWVEVSLGEYVVRAGVPAMCVLALQVRQKARGVMRPVDAPVVSWESMLFHVVRWPWVAVGVTQAIVGRVFGRTLQFSVTPKGTDGPKELPFRPVVIYAEISAALSLVALVRSTSAEASGYYILTLFHAVLYAGAAAGIARLHRRENPDLADGAVSPHLAFAAAAAVFAGFAALVRSGEVLQAIRFSAFLPVPFEGASTTELLTTFAASSAFLTYLAVATMLTIWTVLHLGGRSFGGQPASIRSTTTNDNSGLRRVPLAGGSTEPALRPSPLRRRDIGTIGALGDVG